MVYLYSAVFLGAVRSLVRVGIPAVEDTGLVGWYLGFTSGWRTVRNSDPSLMWEWVASSQLDNRNWPRVSPRHTCSW